MKRYIRSDLTTDNISDSEAIDEVNYNRINDIYMSMPYTDRKLIDPDSEKTPEPYIKSLDKYFDVVAYNIVTEDSFLVAEKISSSQNVDDTKGVEIGIGVIHKGQGIGSRLTSKLVDWFYSQNTYDVLWWPVDEANDASIRVAEENGFFRDPMGSNWVLPKDDAFEKLGLEDYQDTEQYIRSDISGKIAETGERCVMRPIGYWVADKGRRVTSYERVDKDVEYTDDGTPVRRQYSMDRQHRFWVETEEEVYID